MSVLFVLGSFFVVKVLSVVEDLFVGIVGF
jgi:hypothetical protein